MTEAAEEHLKKFLDRHPSLKEYHEMTLMVGEIYREPYHLVDGRQIDALTQKPSYSDVNVNRAYSISYIQLNKNNRDLNMEWLNKRVKATFKTSLNRQSLNHVINRIELQLGGEVRNFIS